MQVASARQNRLVLKIDFFSMPRFHKQRGNLSVVGKQMLLEVPEQGFIRGSKEHIYKQC